MKRYALINAVSKKTPRIHELIEKGIKVNSRSKDRKTALICAAWRGKQYAESTIHALINAGANVDAEDKDGWTALMYATTR